MATPPHSDRIEKVNNAAHRAARLTRSRFNVTIRIEATPEFVK
jgi:hypothetical protein